jgi:hypothetical protein
VKKTRRPLSEWGGGVTHDEIFRLEQVNHHLGIGKAPFREMDGDKTIWCVALHYTPLHYTTSLGASAALFLFASSERL